jgi:D-threo-aldose 1-dehydrogenase
MSKANAINSLNCVERTGLCVSPLGFGGAPLGATSGSKMFTPLTDDQAIEVVYRAFQQGVKLFDTAPLYGHGISETRMGYALRQFSRGSYVVETKLGLVRNSRIIRFSQDSSMIRQSLEESLQRLQLDNVDVLLIHDPDRNYKEAVDILYPELEELRQEGVLKAIGVGINQWQMLDNFLQDTDCDVFMLAHRYTLLDHSALDFLNRCQTRGISVHLAGVYQSGILATGATYGARYIYADAPDEICTKVGQIDAICQCYDVPIRAVAIQFAWAHPAVTSVVVGMSTPEEVYDNIGALTLPIPQDLWKELKHYRLIPEEAPTL